jgi:hypothetical protein
LLPLLPNVLLAEFVDVTGLELVDDLPTSERLLDPNAAPPTATLGTAPIALFPIFSNLEGIQQLKFESSIQTAGLNDI